MKNIRVILSLILCFFTYSACAQTIAAQTFWQMKETQSPIIIDVRTKAEFEQEHIDGAINIPVQQIDLVTKTVTNKDLLIILYCRSGHRAGVALNRLKKEGYTNIYNAGGLNALIAAK